MTNPPWRRANAPASASPRSRRLNCLHQRRCLSGRRRTHGQRPRAHGPAGAKGAAPWANGCALRLRKASGCSTGSMPNLWTGPASRPNRRAGCPGGTFFDDTEVEVQGHQFEGARINYEGNRALSWQTLWFGPWMLDGILDSATDVSEHLGVLLDEHRTAGKGYQLFYADSGSARANSSIALNGRTLAVGVSATTSGPVNWTAWRLNCPRTSGVRAARRPTPGTIHMGQAPTRGMRASGKVRGRAVEERGRPDVALRLYGLQAWRAGQPAVGL